MVTLKEKQISNFFDDVDFVFETNFYTNFLTLDAIKQMLNLNQPQTKALAAEPVWKILIYDRIGQDIISPLISIRELRDLGVTLHM